MKEMKSLPSNFQAWFIEFFKRFTLKTPKFFKILQYAGIVAAFVGFIPDILVWLDITPTDIFSKYLSVALKVAGGVTLIIAKLPASNVSTVIANSTSLPFTEKKIVEGVDPSKSKTENALKVKPEDIKLP